MVRPIYLYGSNLLQSVSRKVTSNDNITEIIQDMTDTIRSMSALGLSAPQIGDGLRIICIKLTDDPRDILIYVNPEVIEMSPEEDEQDEMCLSLPDIKVPVKRSVSIHAKWMDRNMSEHEGTLTGPLARVFLHEVDHLDGVLILSYLTPTQLYMKNGKLKKIKRCNVALPYRAIVSQINFTEIMKIVEKKHAELKTDGLVTGSVASNVK